MRKLVNESGKWWNVFDLKNSNKLWIDLIKLDDILFKRVALIIIWAVLMFTIHHSQHPTDIYRLQRAICGTSAQKPDPGHSVNRSRLIFSVYTVPCDGLVVQFLCLWDQFFHFHLLTCCWYFKKAHKQSRPAGYEPKNWKYWQKLQ